VNYRIYRLGEALAKTLTLDGPGRTLEVWAAGAGQTQSSPPVDSQPLPPTGCRVDAMKMMADIGSHNRFFPKRSAAPQLLKGF